MASHAFVITGLLMLPACATNDDMAALRTQVNNSLMHSQQQIRSRLSALEETKKRMEAQLNTRQAQENRLDVLEAAVKRSLEQQQLLSEDVATVRTAMQGRDDRFLLLLDAQENLYQEGLRTLHAIREQLAGKHSQTGQSRSQAPESIVTLPALPESLGNTDYSKPKPR
jgi:predicted  nucleic acid-binding Zn-ribbon protein